MQVEINFYDEKDDKLSTVEYVFEVENPSVSWMMNMPDGTAVTLMPGKYEIRRTGASDS